MSLADKFGRKWAHSSAVKVGDKLECDPGFTCVARGAVRIVKRDTSIRGFGGLYIDCKDGQHFLDGQLGDDGELDGMYPAQPTRSHK